MFACHGVAHSHLTSVSLANCSPLCRVCCRFPGRTGQTNQRYKTARVWTGVVACTRDADRHRPSTSTRRRFPSQLACPLPALKVLLRPPASRPSSPRPMTARERRAAFQKFLSTSQDDPRPASGPAPAPSRRLRRSGGDPRMPQSQALTRVLAVPALPGLRGGEDASAGCFFLFFLFFSFRRSGVQAGKARAEVRHIFRWLFWDACFQKKYIQ